MMLDKTINDLRIHVSTEGYPPYVRISRPSHVGQPDIQMTFDEADEMLSAMQEMLAEAKGITLDPKFIADEAIAAFEQNVEVNRNIKIK